MIEDIEECSFETRTRENVAHDGQRGSGVTGGAEKARLAAADAGAEPWRDWGPYLAERAWGTVREDYSEWGAAWDYFPHDHARSRAYRWSEDGLAGICDDQQRFCFGLAFWNGADPILKERIFGLSGPEGNHGEDPKEYWWYQDSTPTHSWMRWHYHYPQTAFPYAELARVNRERGRGVPEYELVDTGVFDEGRYWAITADYAKAAPTDMCIRITCENRGPDPATLHVLPTLWFRNAWSWGLPGRGEPPIVTGGVARLVGEHQRLGRIVLTGAGAATPLLCDNEHNTTRLWGLPNRSPYPKDGINDFLVHGRPTVNAARTPAGASKDEALVLRQAIAGLMWSKQFYHYDVARWLAGDPNSAPPSESHRHGRNAHWKHMTNCDVISMPDTWEYPWYAAWDLAFHCVAIAHVDPGYAKNQLLLLLQEWYMHPNGQLPAYEWAFDDVNPPVHAWAALKVFEIDGAGDFQFLQRVLHKLLINFTWWVNRKDSTGNNVFEGGFLGLDNIGPFDRSNHLPVPGMLEQSDGTAWMASYALNLLEIAVVLAHRDRGYADLAPKFFEHFAYIAAAANEQGLWDVRDDRAQLAGAGPAARAGRPAALVPGQQAGVRQRDRVPADPGRPAAAAAVDGQRGAAPAHPPADARRERVPVPIWAARAVQGAPGRAVRGGPRRQRVPRGLRAGRVGHRYLRRQLQLARADLVPGQLPAHRGAAAVQPVLRRPPAGGVPDRLGQEALARGDRRRPVPVPRVLPRRGRPGPGRDPPDRVDGSGREPYPAQAAVAAGHRGGDGHAGLDRGSHRAAGGAAGARRRGHHPEPGLVQPATGGGAARVEHAELRRERRAQPADAAVATGAADRLGCPAPDPRGGRGRGDQLRPGRGGTAEVERRRTSRSGGAVRGLFCG